MTSPASKIGQIAGVLERGLVSVFIYLYWWPSNEPSAENITADCLERLRLEGNTYLLRKEELPPISKSRTSSGASGPECGDLFINAPAVPNGVSFLSNVSNAGASTS